MRWLHTLNKLLFIFAEQPVAQVVGVREHDSAVHGHQLLWKQALQGALGANRHEDGGVHHRMGQGHLRHPRPGGRALGQHSECQGWALATSHFISGASTSTFRAKISHIWKHVRHLKIFCKHTKQNVKFNGKTINNRAEQNLEEQHIFRRTTLELGWFRGSSSWWFFFGVRFFTWWYCFQFQGDWTIIYQFHLKFDSKQSSW